MYWVAFFTGSVGEELALHLQKVFLSVGNASRQMHAESSLHEAQVAQYVGDCPPGGSATVKTLILPNNPYCLHNLVVGDNIL